jgi:hypothetical protein
MVKISTDKSDGGYMHAPFSLFPTPYPKHLFEHAQHMQDHFCNLIADLISQPKLMVDMLHYFQEHDPLLKRLIDISVRFNALERKQDL